MTGIFGTCSEADGFFVDESSPQCATVLRSMDSAYTIAISGELFVPSGDILTQENFSTAFVPPFLENADSFLARCEGSYVFALFNGKARRLHLVTDPFGNLALHYHYAHDSICFSTMGGHVAQACHVAGRNEQAVQEYVAFGQALSGKTLYEGVHRLGVASHLQFSRTELSIHRYSTPSFETRSKSDYPEILSAIRDRVLYNVAIRTCGNGRVRSGLSGGFDSRVVLAALHHLERKNVELFTLGLPDCTDLRIASRLAVITGFPHSVFRFDEEFISGLRAYWEQTVVQSEGGLGIESSPQFAVWKQLEAHGIRHLDGHGGPIYRRQILKASIHTAHRYPSMADCVFDRMKSPLVRSGVLEKTFCAEAESQTRRALGEYFNALPEVLTAGDRIDRFYIEQQCAHHYALAGNTEMQFTGLSHPLLSARVWELISQLGDSFRATNAVHRYLIHAFSPALEAVPLDNNGFTVPYRGYELLRYLPQAYERYFVKTISGLSPALGNELSLQHSPYTLRMVELSSPGSLREIAMSESADFDSIFNRAAIEKLSSVDPALGAVANAKLLLGSLRDTITLPRRVVKQ